MAFETSSFIHQFLPFFWGEAFEMWGLLLSGCIINFHWDYSAGHHNTTNLFAKIPMMYFY
jgi:hypothetical protein